MGGLGPSRDGDENRNTMCLYPKLIKNRKYTVTKKNKGIVPKITDPRTAYVPIGCTKCIECRKQKARGWNVRLQEEIRHDKTGEFVTLTFSNESIKKILQEINYVDKDTGEELLTGYELDNEIATKGVRLFLERWRKKYGKSVKHWLITELGHNGTENIHMHGIIFTNAKTKTEKLKLKEDIKKIWGYGFVYIGDYVSENTVNYMMKYCQKIDLKHREYNPKILTSAGIGNKYTERLDAKLNKFKYNGETRETYVSRQGSKMNLPIYYRNKIYSEVERELLWLQKLDKQERWILGVKISTKKGMDTYYRSLLEARQLNRRLGYGTDEKNWKRLDYENQRRKMNIEKRIAEKIYEE